MIEGVEPCPLLDDRKESDDTDSRNEQLRGQDNCCSARDDTSDKIEQDDEGKEDGQTL